MLFKDLKQGYPVFLLFKGDGMVAETGKTVAVSQPYLPPIKPGGYPFQGQGTTQMLVDVTVESSKGTKTYSIPETLSVTYAEGVVLSTERDGILRDVEAIKNQSAEIINSMDKHKKIVEDCDKILEEWNPQIAETRRQDQRISGLETKVESIGKMLSDFINEFKK